MLFHATAVVRDGWTALLTGPPGAGKSDLALRLIDRGWRLLADDYVRLECHGERLTAHAPEPTRGLIEVRGFGIAKVEAIDAASVILLVELGGEVERLPPPRSQSLLGITLPTIALDPRPASAPILVELAFARALAGLDD